MTPTAIAVQTGIVLFSGLAAWLVNDARPQWRRHACWIGLLGQPCWAYAAWESQQFGVMAMTAWYTYCWWRGFYGQWIKGD